MNSWITETVESHRLPDGCVCNQAIIRTAPNEAHAKKIGAYDAHALTKCAEEAQRQFGDCPFVIRTRVYEGPVQAPKFPPLPGNKK